MSPAPPDAGRPQKRGWKDKVVDALMERNGSSGSSAPPPPPPPGKGEQQPLEGEEEVEGGDSDG